MRLWPYQMLDVLPRMQMLSQWRECLAVGGMLGAENLNHATVNRVKDYPIEHFMVYCDLVREEFANRGWTIGTNTLEKLKNDIGYEENLDNKNYTIVHSLIDTKNGSPIPEISVIYNDEKDTTKNYKLFYNFHNERYLKQCLYSFQEKYDCGMLTDDEWNKIVNKFPNLVEK